jgi:hypothetical protein
MIAALRLALAAAAAVSALSACGGGEPGGPGATPDSRSSPDAPGGTLTLPTWRLEDIQPESPRVGQTYGLDTFAGKIVAVTLVEGF